MFVFQFKMSKKYENRHWADTTLYGAFTGTRGRNNTRNLSFWPHKNPQGILNLLSIGGVINLRYLLPIAAVQGPNLAHALMCTCVDWEVTANDPGTYTS